MLLKQGGVKMKVNIANYLIEDLSNRFPMAHTGIIDNDIIDVMVDGWYNHRYHTPSFNGMEGEKNTPRERLLM